MDAGVAEPVAGPAAAPEPAAAAEPASSPEPVVAPKPAPLTQAPLKQSPPKQAAPAQAPPAPAPPAPGPRVNGSLRRRVHAALNEHVPANDVRDNTQLLELVGNVLQLTDLERVTATSYVRSWRRDTLETASAKA